MDVVLSMDQVDDPPPDCPRCTGATHQEFKPIALGGSARSRAVNLALEIAEKDYGVADIQAHGKEGGTPTVRYRDETPASIAAKRLGGAAAWGANREVLEGAIAAGRAQRISNGGDGLDVLKSALKSGAQPDLIEVSKRRSMRVW